MHRNDNMRLMRENVGLTREINELRRELRIEKQYRRNSPTGGPATDGGGSDEDGGGGSGGGGGGGAPIPRPPPGGKGGRKGGGGGGRGGEMDAEREIEMQRQQIEQLRTHISRLEQALNSNAG